MGWHILILVHERRWIPICVLTDNISLHAHASLAIQTCHLERGLVSGDDGASCAWPFLVRRKVEDGTSKDAKAAPERAGGRPRARTRTPEGPERSSLLEMGRRESSI